MEEKSQYRAWASGRVPALNPQGFPQGGGWPAGGWLPLPCAVGQPPLPAPTPGAGLGMEWCH